MKKNIIEFLEESIHEKKLSHAFLIETSNYENLDVIKIQIIVEEITGKVIKL